MKLLFLLSFLIFANLTFAQSNYDAKIKEYQNEMNREFADSATSPLTKQDLLRFKHLIFFPVDSMFCITARYEITPNDTIFEMITTTSRRPLYQRVAIVYFKIDTVDCKLNVYKNIDLSKKTGFEDYLFIPFTDATNGIETYAGGRYLDVRIPNSDTLILDFNKAYNPYCAYNKKYSCPVPPAENDLNVRIVAGVLKFEH